MTTFKLLGAAAVLSAIIVSSASAQAVVQEPGMYAFYHPNSDSACRIVAAGRRRPGDGAAPVMRHPAPARQARSAK